MPLCSDHGFCGGLCVYTHCNEALVNYDNEDLRTGYTFALSALSPNTINDVQKNIISKLQH